MAHATKSTMLYWTTFSIAGAVAAAAVVFFFIGIGDGSVSGFNITLWLGLLATVAAVMFAGPYLRGRGRTGAAIAALCVLAVPGLVFGLFVALILLTNPRWN